jgi:hypothetical protein
MLAGEDTAVGPTHAGRLSLLAPGYFAGGVGVRGLSGGGRGDEEPFEERAALGYGHGHHYAAKVLYLGLALDPACVEGFVEGCPERIGEDDPDEEEFLRGIWEEYDDRDFVLEALKGGVEVRTGRQ